MGERVNSAAGGLSLTDILGVIWRRRSLVLFGTLGGVAAGIAYGLLVTPLHRATATVQPGITTFDVEMQPVREWRIKDVEVWFRRGDFNPTLAHRMGRDASKFQPIIIASTIPRGPQSIGGNTITLTTLDPNPEQAVEILETAIDVFNHFAASDTLRSNLWLMRASLRGQIESHDARVKQLDAKLQRIEMSIAARTMERENTKAEISVIETMVTQYRTNVEAIAAAIRSYEAALERSGKDVASLTEDIVGWQNQSETLMKDRERLLQGSGGDVTTLLLVSQAVGDLIDDLGGIRLGLIEHSSRTLAWEDRLQELQKDHVHHQSELAMQIFQRDHVLPKRILDLDQQITNLELERDFDLSREAAGIRGELNLARSRLNSLSPLEEMGRVTASARPVRPRKLRATAILGALGLIASIFLAFTLEYLSNNWKTITQGSTRPL